MASSRGHFYWLLALTAFIWGAQPILVKLAVQEITPVTLTAARHLLIGLTLFLVLVRQKARILPPRHCLVPLIVMGLTGVAINNVTQFTGLRFSTVANATLISATTPAITAALAVVFIRERLLPIQWAGIVISLCGTVYLVTGGSPEILLQLSFNVGDLLFILSQTGWAVYSLVGARVMQHLPILPTTAWSGLFGALFTALYGILTGELHAPAFSPVGLACFGYITWVGGVCAMVFWNASVKVVGASEAAIFLNIMPLVGILTGVIFLDETFELREGFGAVAILSGVWLITQARRVQAWRDRAKRDRRRNRLARKK